MRLQLERLYLPVQNARMKYLLTLLALVPVLFFACDPDDQFTTNSGDSVNFSTDTLRFDTVFTELGSATRSFRIKNPHDENIRISSIFLEQGENSFFRMNVDGIAGNNQEDITVLAKDSIWVFVEVTIDPDQPESISPFVIEERVIIEVNDNVESVQLEAWGQNANYFPSRFNAGVPVVLTCSNQELTWDDPKPYVIYGVVFIDSCTLNIPPGTEVYVHGGVARNDLFGVFNDGILYTLANGKLNVQGTMEEPVIFQGDRLEEDFAESTGQWNGIILGRGSQGNRIEHAIIKNSIFGVYVDSAAMLNIANTRIFNTNSSAIAGFHGTILAENCLFYNNFSNSVQLTYGGNYFFNYCTLASYGVDASALGVNNFFCADDPFVCEDLRINPLNATFRNCILFGSSRDEIQLGDIFGGENDEFFNVNILNSVVRVDQLLSQQDGLYNDFFETICRNCVNGDFSAPLFANENEDDYHLDSLSIAIQRAQPIPAIPLDLERKMRDPVEPDAGALEYQEQ